MSKKCFVTGLIGVLQVVTGAFVFAQNRPDLLCNTVAVNGDVSLTWAKPLVPDTCTGFLGYEIFSSKTLNGTYSLAGTVPLFNQNSYTHIGAGASDQKTFYYVKTKENCGNEYFSDTLSTILLNPVRSGPVAALSWNSPEPVSTQPYLYDIYREYPEGTGNWTKINTTASLNYSDTIIYCTNPRYRIETRDGTCAIESSFEDGFEDVIGPGITEITTVTVDNATGKALITWPVNPAKDTEGYYILTYKNALSDPTTLDTVYGRNTTSFLDPLSDPSVESKAYLLMPFDSCGKFTRVGFLDHHTIFLSVQSNVCDKSTSLKWNKYLNWPGGVSRYEVYANAILVATLDSNTLFYTHTGLSQSTNYVYTIKAVPVAVAISPSVSNKVSVTTGNMTAPTFISVKSVTVTGPRQVAVTGSVDSLADISGYRLIRSTSAAGPFEKVQELAGTSSGTIMFTDNSAQTKERSYFYKVEAIDSCGGLALTSSNTGRTMHVSVNPESDFTNTMTWNAYSSSDSIYVIYRSIDGVWDNAPVAIIPLGKFFYSDDISSLPDGEGNFCYRVQAVVKYAKNYQDISNSNEFCIVQSPRLFIPTAFVPTGVNAVLYPINVYAEAKSYVFTIYNRWGDKIFETNDPLKGWDGTYNGSIVQQGIYLYVVSFTGTNEKMLNRTGTVHLIR